MTLNLTRYCHSQYEVLESQIVNYRIFDMPTVKIIIPGDDPPQIVGSPHLDRLKTYGDIVLHTTKPSSSSAKMERVTEADIIINCYGGTPWRKHELQQLPNLKMISLSSVGTDMIDLGHAREMGIVVSNVRGETAPIIAEHMFGLMLAAAKRCTIHTAQIKSGEWQPRDNVYLHGKTLGIIGTGNSGSAMAKLGNAIGMNVIAWTFHPSKEKAHKLNVKYVEFNELLSTSDVISLHIKLTEESRNILNSTQFALMKPGVILVNGARAGLIDTDALVKALETNKLSGVALDVYDIEPIPLNHDLLAFNQVVLTPHIADQTPEGREILNKCVVDNAIAFLNGTPQNVVS